MNLKPRKIPRYIDEPMPILAWRIDDIAPVILGFAMGIVLDKMIWTLGTGVIVMRVYRRMRETTADGWMRHKLYEYGIGKNARTIPDCTYRHFN